MANKNKKAFTQGLSAAFAAWDHYVQLLDHYVQVLGEMVRLLKCMKKANPELFDKVADEMVSGEDLGDLCWQADLHLEEFKKLVEEYR